MKKKKVTKKKNMLHKTDTQTKETKEHVFRDRTRREIKSKFDIFLPHPDMHSKGNTK